MRVAGKRAAGSVKFTDAKSWESVGFPETVAVVSAQSGKW
jgi:hypothetical protein